MINGMPEMLLINLRLLLVLSALPLDDLVSAQLPAKYLIQTC